MSDRPAASVGRRLAQIGDSINAHYTPEFNSMIKLLNPSPDTAFEAFYRVTDRFAMKRTFKQLSDLIKFRFYKKSLCVSFRTKDLWQFLIIRSFLAARISSNDTTIKQQNCCLMFNCCLNIIFNT